MEGGRPRPPGFGDGGPSPSTIMFQVNFLILSRNMNNSCIFIDRMCGSRTVYAADYARIPGLPLARELADGWLKAVVDFHPGDEYDLVRRFVQALRLDSWLEIKPSVQ